MSSSPPPLHPSIRISFATTIKVDTDKGKRKEKDSGGYGGDGMRRRLSMEEDPEERSLPRLCGGGLEDRRSCC